MNFINKTIIVTGASSGIGAAIAIKFASIGANVAIVGRNRKKLDNVLGKIKRMEKNGITIIADITKDDEVKNIIDETVNQFGKLDVLVNNAGIFTPSSVISDDAINIFDHVMATNLRGAVKLTNLAGKYLMETKGNIVNISSIGSLGVFSSASFSYCTSKAGLDHFTRSVAVELSKYGIRVNAVNPGAVETDFLEAMGITDSDEKKMILDAAINSSLLGKLVEAEEVADLVAFLASDMAKSITGSTYVIDNGMLLKRSIGL